MPPQLNKNQADEPFNKEDSPLIGVGMVPSPTRQSRASMYFSSVSSSFSDYSKRISRGTFLIIILGVLILTTLIVAVKKGSHREPIGPYSLVECQEGNSFFDYYSFYDGADSLGSAGYNDYVSKNRATELGILNVTEESVDHDVFQSSNSSRSTKEQTESFIYMSSAPTKEGPRQSIRLEGKRLYNRGLFIIDLRHMPAGCGIWPAFWLTNEESWPDKGEIDVVEGVNYQSVAKTALHTSAQCSMYAHVPGYSKTGTWDWATGIPDTWTGLPDFNTSKEADDCWASAPHQWGNQGCVAVSSDEGTLGIPFNTKGGGVYALEWDPSNRYIRTWVFAPHNTVPENLMNAIQSASERNPSDRVMPDTNEWGLPYGYFAIGEGTGCSADHFQDMRLVVNLAFCGTVSGNRYFRDCPEEAKEFKVKQDPILSCNAWIKSNPKALEEAYWKIRGIYVYQREMETPPSPETESTYAPS